jgi:hypothetical protein
VFSQVDGGNNYFVHGSDLRLAPCESLVGDHRG